MYHSNRFSLLARTLNVAAILPISLILAVSLGSLVLAQAVDRKRPAGEALSDLKLNSRQLKFDFAKADWQSVLNWFANEAGLDLEWVELPEGEFNLTTERTYSITESLDIINMHLLPRGFSLMRRDEVLIAIKLTENFDTTLVPRVEPEQLNERGRFDFVKVSFELDWLLAESAVKELSPMLSSHGKLVPLTKTNRIEAMDTVGNLLEIRDLLSREESNTGQERLVAEFSLEYTNATEIIGKLHQLLGVDKPLNRMSDSQMRVEREKFAFKAELAKRLGDNAPSLRENPTEVFLVANEQRNSIVANAPPDKVAMIRQAVQALDVPNSNQGSRLGEITTMKVYPLNGADPDAVADILQDLVDIGELHPNARFSEDDDKQILFAFASLKDHITINSVMEQLAGSSRSFNVIPLRRLKAAYVARAIATLMGAEVSSSSEDRDTNRRQNSSSWNGFKVDADIPSNRLYLFATDAENKQVEELLVKIGERPRPVGGARVIRVPSQSIEDTLNEVREQWPAVSDSPLDISVSDDSNAADDSPAASQSNQQPGGREAEAYVSFTQSSATDLGSGAPKPSRNFLEPTAADRLAPRPPVVIRKRGLDELVISSLDPVALEQMESLVSGYLPASPPYTTFSLKFASPISIESKLMQVFDANGIGMSMPIRFVADVATSSIMVLGAGPSELSEIKQFIERYDQPPLVDPTTQRKPRHFMLQHANAEAVMTSVKDLYRDYLSANDRDVVQQGGRRPTQYFSSLNAGLLSLSVYPDTNVVVVSAPEFLTEEIAITIEELDVPEAATVIRTIPMGNGLYSTDAMSQLTKLLKRNEAATRRDQANRERVGREQQPDREQEENAEPQSPKTTGLRGTPAPARRNESLNDSRRSR